MEVLFAAFWIIVGLIILTIGGDILVDGAVSVARKWNVSVQTVGLTIVAIGTSMPELVVSVIAAIEWKSELAIGNILGTNIVNYLWILGIVLLITPITLTKTNKNIDLPLSAMAAFLLFIMVHDTVIEGSPINVLSRIDGIILILLAFLYILFSLKYDFLSEKPLGGEVETILSPFKSVLWILWGIVALFTGGQILVNGAVDFARILGMSETVIGLTIVAIGTSMPELMTSIVAVRKWKAWIAVGNLIGSSILNILIILWVWSLLRPLPFLSGSSLDISLNILIPFLILLLIHMSPRKILDRKAWILFIILYILYMTYLLIFRI